MTPTNRYAIKCSTEEQAIECVKHKLQPCSEKHSKYFTEDYTIIFYEEAKEKKLLGEKEEDLSKRWYAPGHYAYWDCADCECRLENVKIRTWRCKKCATKARDNEVVYILETTEQQSDVVEKIMNSIFWDYKNSSEWFSVIPNRVRKTLEKYL